MSVKLCRICLNKDVKLFKLEQCNLKQYYEQITQSKVLSGDELPRYACFECAALLHKYHKFKEKCDYGQTTLKKLMCSGFMNYHVIEDIRKNRSDLQSSSDYINYVCGKRIKTVNVKYKVEIEPLEMENVIVHSLPDEQDVFKFEYESDHDNDVTDNIIKCEDQESDMAKTDNITANTDSDSTKTYTVLTDPDYTKTSSIVTKTSPVLTETKPVFSKTDSDLPTSEQGSLNKNDSVLKDPILKLEDDSSNDVSMDIDDVVKVANEDKVIQESRRKRDSLQEESQVDVKETSNRTEKATAKNKDDKKPESNKGVKDSDTNYRFVGIIREPKGELSKDNWETKLLTENEAMEQFKKKEFDSKYERMEFKCIKCFKGFSKNEMLLRHNKMWHDQGENECRFCHMQYKFKSQLRKHMMKHYYIYKCLRCGLQFYLKHVAVFHDSHHNGVIHKCKHCGEEYTHISSYYTHLRMSHRNAHACKLCGATFVSQAGVLYHMKRKHVMHAQSTEGPSTNIYCQKCKISFVSQGAYDEHLSQSKLHEEENKEFKRTRSKKRDILADPTECIHCNKKFESKTEVKAHIADEHSRHNKVERVVCEICGAVLSSAYIDIHMNRHTRKKVYPCQTCGKEFLCATSHNTHQLKHSGEKPHPCPICPKRYSLKGDMEVHYKRVHLKELYPKSVQKPKLTDCPVCHKTFQSKSNMETHLKRVHLKEPYPKRTYNRKNRNRQPSEVPLEESLPK